MTSAYARIMMKWGNVLAELKNLDGLQKIKFCNRS